MISFEPLFDLLKSRGISLYHLTRDKVVGKATLENIRLGKKGITTDTIAAICRYLDCQPGDIMAYAPDDLAKQS